MSEHPNPESLQLSVARLDSGASVVSASGEIDVSTAGSFMQTLKDVMHTIATPPRRDAGHGVDPFGDDETAGAPIAVLDLTEVSFMDSSGLGALIAARSHATRLDRSWRLCGVQQDVLRVMALSGVATQFNIYPDLDAATADGPLV